MKTLCAALIAAVALLFAVPAAATFCVPGGQPAQPPPPPPAPSQCNLQCSNCTNSPCYVATGMYVREFEDLRIRTAGTFPLLVTRRYDTGRPTDGPLGAGWSSSLTAHLYYATYLIGAPGTYSYEADVTMPDGTLLKFVRNNDGTFTPPPGRYDVLTKAADGSYMLSLQHTRSAYRFGADGALTSSTDDYGNVISYTYDAAGRLQRVADTAGSGRYLDVVWGADGRIASVTDNANRVLKYFYDTASGTLTGYSDAVVSGDSSQRSAYYTYETSRFGPVLNRIEDRWHRIVSKLQWYRDGRLQSYTDGDFNDADPSSSVGEKYSFVYATGVTTKTHSLGQRVYLPATSGVANNLTSTFDTTTGLTTSVTYPDGHGAFYTYNARGNIATMTENGTTWTYSYDATFPDAVATVISSTPAEWAGWRYTYNTGGIVPAGALATVERYGSDATSLQRMATYIYDPQGHVTFYGDAEGRSWLYGYDAAGNLTSVSINGKATMYGYDSVGRVILVTPPSGHSTSYTYDAADRMTAVTLPSPSASPTLDFTMRITYDSYDATTGFVTTASSDVSGRTTSRGFDALGHLRQLSDPLGNTTRITYRYDLPGSMTDANGNVTSYQYNSNRDLVRTTFFDGTYETYGRNAYGGLTDMTDRRGQLTYYTYDGFGRISAVTYGSATVRYGYTGPHVVSVSDGRYSPALLTSRTLDTLWRVVAETQPGGDRVTLTYDGSSNRTASYQVAPPTGQTGTTVSASMTYDAEGRVNTISWSPVSGTFSYTYTADGKYSTVTFPNSQRRTYTYDDQGRLTRLSNTAANNSLLADFSYSYDYDWSTQSYTALGNRTGMAMSGSAVTPGSANYMYDAAQELIGVTRPGGAVITYDYDAIGNRLRMGGPSGITYYQYSYFQNTAGKNTPRLRNGGGADLGYDANGNVTSEGAATYGWDAQNRLVTAVGANIQYDDAGHRYLYTPSANAGAAVRYVTVSEQTVAERSADSTRTNDYLYAPGIDQPLARRSAAGVVQYYLVDGSGSVVATTNAASQVLARWSYDEWGNIAGTTSDLLGFTARETTSINGSLWYYRARYYRSDWARFMSEDPARLPFETNPYVYVSNSPQNYVDPSGYVKCKLGEPLTQVCAVGPLKAWKAKNLADEALAVAHASGLPGAHNGLQDAFRHCYWSCRMAQELGPSVAKTIGDIHEECGNGPANENAMDQFNNSVGRSFGLPNINCAGVCQAALLGGKLQNHP